MVYKSSSIAAGGGSSGTGGGTISNLTSTGGTITVGSPTGPTTNVDVAANTANTLAGYNNSGIFSDVAIGANLSLSGGTLSASGGGAVSSVFGRTGAVSANYSDYAFNLISGVASVSQGGTGLQTLTSHSVLLGEGVSNVSFATTGTPGRLLIDQGTSDPLFELMSGDAVIAATGAITFATVNTNTGSFGSSTSIPNFTVNGKGLITAAGGNAVVAPAGTLTGTTLASNITASSLTTVGALASGSLAVGFTPVSNALLANSAITVGAQTGLAGGGSVALGSAITLSMGTNTANTLAGYNSSGVFSDVTIGSSLGLSGGVLSGTSSASVTSVFGRIGAVTAQWNDYNFNLLGGTAAVSQGGTGQTSLTSHAVLLGEGAVTGVGFATTGTAARILIDQGAADPKFLSVTGDSSMLSTGVMTNTAVNGVSYPASPGTNTVPVVTGSNTITYEAVPNAALLNSAITIGAQTGLAGGGTVSLGSKITMSMGTSVANTLAGYNSSGVFSDVSIGTNLNLVSGILATSAFSQGSGVTITYSSNTIGLSASGVSAGVSSISNTDGGSLTITPQTAAVTANLNTAFANTWTATQTGAVSGGVTSFVSTGALEFAIFANGNSGTGTPTLKWENGNLQSVTISGACTLGFTLPTHPARLTVISTMSATTGFPYAYAGTVLWPSGTKPTLSSISNAKDISSFVYDGVSVYGVANTAFS